MKSYWSDPVMRERMISRARQAWDRRPTHPEVLMNELLTSLFSGKYRYTGDMSFCVGCRNPDFTNHDDRKLIEVFGDYFHQGEDPSKRIRYFEKHSWKCLVIWEHELYEEQDSVERKLVQFQEELKCLT